MNILILAAGRAPADIKDDQFPLCLTEFDGIPLIEAISKKITPLGAQKTVLAIPENDVASFHLDRIAKLLFPCTVIIRTRGTTQGAACTALLSIEHINNDDELLIVSANELVDINFTSAINSFRARNLDAGTITFSSVHPRYSYVRTNEENLVVEAAQKNPISRSATTGIFWFARGRDFVTAAKQMIRKGARTDSMYFICPTFNELILTHARIGTVYIEARQYHPLKSERQIHQFESMTESSKGALQ